MDPSSPMLFLGMIHNMKQETIHLSNSTKKQLSSCSGMALQDSFIKVGGCHEPQKKMLFSILACTPKMSRKACIFFIFALSEWISRKLCMNHGLSISIWNRSGKLAN